MTNKQDKKSQESIDECINQCKQVFLIGIKCKTDEAINQLGQLSSVANHHAQLYAMHQLFLIMLRSFATAQKSDVAETISMAESLIQVCDQHMRPRSQLLKWLTKPNYDNYTDDQVFSILVKANALNVSGQMTMVMDHKLMSLVKAAFRMQSSMTMINECASIAERRTSWATDAARSMFEDGVKNNQAFLTLILSHFPERIIRFLTFFGYDCDRDKALATMYQLSDNSTSTYEMICKIQLGLYECLAKPLFGARPQNLDRILKFADSELADHSTSWWALLIKAMALKLNGDIDSAIDHYKRCIETQIDSKQLHTICHWDMSFCHGLKMEWDQAAQHVGLLPDQCDWSKASFVYMKASFLYMKMIDENRPDLKSEISELFRLVPTLKQVVNGKTIAIEKYICDKADNYFTNNETIVLPAFDYFILWNTYSLAVNNPKLLDPIIDKINVALKNYQQQCGQLQEYYHLLLIKGVCYKFQNKHELATISLQKIMQHEDDVDNEHLLAMTALEMGLTKLNAKSYSEAEYWLKRAQRYRKYFFKTLIHFRAHSGLQKVKECWAESISQ